jgi:hypothetical protein
LGNYTIPIKVFHDDKAGLKVEVRREDESGGEAKSKPEAKEGQS